MAFNLRVNLTGYEYRGVRSGTSQKTGKPWYMLIIEDIETSRQLEVGVPQELQAEVYSQSLHRGDIIDCVVDAVAGGQGDRAYSFINLVQLPTISKAAVDY